MYVRIYKYFLDLSLQLTLATWKSKCWVIITWKFYEWLVPSSEKESSEQQQQHFATKAAQKF